MKVHVFKTSENAKKTGKLIFLGRTVYYKAAVIENS